MVMDMAASPRAEQLLFTRIYAVRARGANISFQLWFESVISVRHDHFVFWMVWRTRRTAIESSNDYKGGAAAVFLFCFVVFFKHERPQMSVKVRYAGRIHGKCRKCWPHWPYPEVTLPGDSQRLLKKRGRRRVQTFHLFSDIFPSYFTSSRLHGLQSAVTRLSIDGRSELFGWYA